MKRLILISIALILTISVFAQDKKFTTSDKTIIGVWVNDMDSSVKIVIYKKTTDKIYYAFVDSNTKTYDHSWEKHNELTVRNSKYYIDYKNSPIGSGFEQWYVISSNGLKAYDAQGFIALYNKSSF